jgi:hypothetical protein
LTAEEVKIGGERVPWALVIIISVLLPFIGTYCVLVGKTGLKFWTGIGLIQPVVPIVIGPFLVLYLAFIAAKLFKKGIDIKSLGYLYVVAVSATLSLISVEAGTAFNDFIGTRMVGNDVAQSYIPPFMAPSQKAAQLLWSGGVFPLGEWIPVMAFYWILYLMPSILLIGVATLFRRRWIDVEKVPFPTTMVAYEVLRRVPSSVTSPSSQGTRRMTLFVAGLAMGLVIQTLYVLIQLFPWFPDIFAIREGCGSGCALVWYVKADTPLAGIVGLGTINTHPMVVAFFYFIPLSILFNSWFWYLVYLVLMQAAYMMGYYTGANTIGGCGRGWCAGYSGLLSPPYNFMAVSQVGGMIGLTIFSIFLSRGYLMETLRAAFGTLPKETVEIIERDEAASYRAIWLLITLGFVGTTAVFMTMGLSVMAALLMPITFFIFLFADSRLYGLSGGYMRGWNTGASGVYRLLWPTAPDPLTREFVVGSFFSGREYDMGSGRLWAPSYGSFDSYRMSALVHLSNKKVLKILLVVALISPITVYVSEVLIGYTYGLSIVLGRCASAYTCGAPWGYSAASWARTPSSEPWIPYMIAGIAIIGVLSLLRARFIWFPFEPIGFLNGTSYNSIISGLWFPFLIAWVLKTATLRIGGSKTYENYGLPLAGGVVAGCAVIAILGTILGIIRFYVPF